MSELSELRGRLKDERERRIALEAQNLELLAIVKQLTHVREPSKPREQGPDPERTALERAEAPVIKKAEKIFIENTVKSLMAQGYSKPEAEKEAKRLRREVTDMQPESA